MKFKINYSNIPVLAIGFTESKSVISKLINFFQGTPSHAFLVTEDHGQLFATEETLNGLRENSLEEYTSDSKRIVAMYIWDGFTKASTREAVQRYLAEIRRKAKENSKYDFKGLFSFVPVFKWFMKPDPKRQWCSENVAKILQVYGCEAVKKVTISPRELYKLVQDNKDEFHAVLGYYK